MGSEGREQAGFAVESLTRRLLEVVPGGLVQISADGAIVGANEEALRILHLSLDELTRRYTSDFESETIWEDGTPCSPEDYPVTRALATGERQPAVMIGVRRPGHETSWAMYTAIPMRDDAGQVTGAFVTLVDVTRQRALDVALRHSEARLRAIIASVPGYVLLVDRELRIRFISRVLPGFDADALVGQSIFDFMPASEHEAPAAKLRHAIETGTPTTLEITIAAWASGGIYRLAVGPVKENGTVTGLTLIAEDISDHKELEARFLLSERLASIGTLAAGIAHEINNPLTYVLGNLELLKPQLADRPALHGLVEQIDDGAERIAHVVSDLMTFTYREDGASCGVCVSTVVDRAARVAHHELARRARFVREPFAVPDVIGTPARIGQVLLNLLINAAHAIAPGHVADNEIRVSARVVADDRVRISVRDTGSGIDRALLSRIFDPFITTKPLGDGTGLGLYVCHNIVSALGGTLWVESQVGKGSTFHVDLPVYHGDGTARSEVSDDAAKVSAERSLRLLVIDDEPSITTFVKHALHAHEVATARCGEDGLLALESRVFDAVLCDLVMPDLSGMQVYERVKVMRPELASRFLFITGAALGDLGPEVAASKVPVLHKPFSVRALREAVRTLADGESVRRA